MITAENRQYCEPSPQLNHLAGIEESQHTEGGGARGISKAKEDITQNKHLKT